MKIERNAVGTLHVIESMGARTLRFESVDDDPLMQFLASLSEEVKDESGYDVRRYARARITLLIEAEGLPEYMQQL